MVSLGVSGAVEGDPVKGKLGLVRVGIQYLSADITIDLLDDEVEGSLDIGGVEGGCLHEEHAFSLCQTLSFLH